MKKLGVFLLYATFPLLLTAVTVTAQEPVPPDLAITKSHPGSFRQGGTGSYTLIARNVGPVSTTGTVSVNDRLPPDLMATSIGGTGWSCTLSTLTCTRSDSLAARPAIHPSP